MSVKTQGTEVFVADTVTSSVATLIKMACPTAVTGLGGAADQIDDTCLDARTRTFVRGLDNPGQVTIPFVLKPSEASHQALFDLKDDGSAVEWCIALSDGTAQPTLDSNDAIVAPASRTSFIFSGYVADITIDIATNEVVRGTLLVQRRGAVTPTWKA
mgnify:CR=1 FL=1